MVLAGPDLKRDGVVRWRCSDLRTQVKARLEVGLHGRTVGKLLRKLGMTRLQPRPFHPKSDAEAQEAHENFTGLVAEALPPEAAGKAIEVWFQDGQEPKALDRVGRQGTLSYVWAPIGSRPARVRDRRRQSAHLFGAICPARAVGAAIVMPRVSSEAMTLHLEEISKAVGKAAHAVLACDGAGWRRSGGRLTVPENVTLLRLPPYAPEPNPMENVWERLRGNQPSMTAWRTYTAIPDACCNAWNSR